MEVNSGRFDGRANLKPWKPGQSGNPRWQAYRHAPSLLPGIYQRLFHRLAGRGLGSCSQGGAQKP